MQDKLLFLALSIVLNAGTEAHASVPVFFQKLWKTTGNHCSTTASRYYEDFKKIHARSIDIQKAPSSAEVQLNADPFTLPEILVDTSPSALFPLPLSPPFSLTWPDLCADALALVRTLNRENNKNPNEIQWPLIDEKIKTLSLHTRTLKLYGNDSFSKNSTRLTLIKKIHKKETLTEDERQILFPKIIAPKPYFAFGNLANDATQAQKEDQTFVIPVVINSEKPEVARFMREFDGAIDTFWNQSHWAKTHHVQIKLHWISKKTFEKKTMTAEEFNQIAWITPGGLTTYVKNNILYLGASAITPRILAHEFGHLLGYEDCYERTIDRSSFFGLAPNTLQEWTNPAFPDELMCDNLIGEKQ